MVHSGAAFLCLDSAVTKFTEYCSISLLKTIRKSSRTKERLCSDFVGVRGNVWRKESCQGLWFKEQSIPLATPMPQVRTKRSQPLWKLCSRNVSVPVIHVWRAKFAWKRVLNQLDYHWHGGLPKMHP